MRTPKRRFLWSSSSCVVLAFSFLFVAQVSSVEAIPAWSRKYEVSCTQCHTAWPKLNAYGRDFKIDGFRIPDELEDPDLNAEISDFLTLDRSFPVAARFVMRPFDKKKDKRAKIRSFHEVELFMAGRVSKNFSAFVEFEAEDEEEFNLFTEHALLGWHPYQEANVVMGWAPPFWADPFDTLADGGRRMTRAHKGPLDLLFSARERLRSESQWVGFYGRAAGRVFYNAGVSSGGDDPEGRDARDGFGRVMVETVPGVYLGGFVLAGTNETQAVDLDFSRAGFDFQIEQGNFNAYGLVLHANDDLLTGGEVSNTVGYVEAFCTIPLARIPMIVPLVRVDVLDEFTDLTANLNFYVMDNIKAYVEWWQNMDTPTGISKNNRVTVQVDLAF